MTTISSHTRFRRLAILLLPTVAWVGCLQAQTFEATSNEPATTVTPYALFQYASLTGSGNTINLTRVPTANSSGTISYYDVTIEFTVNSSGQLAIASGYPQITPSPSLITAGFKAGKYVGPSTILDGEMFVNVSGPGVTSGGATEWSLAAASGAADCTYPSTATWYVGALTSNPLYSRIKAAGITSTAWSYGVTGAANCYDDWLTDTLIGVSQNGNTITIVSFTNDGTDHNTVQDTVTYTPAP